MVGDFMKSLAVFPAALLAFSSSLAGADMTLSSDSFKDNGVMPAKFATTKVNGGKNISPGLKWAGAPTGTKSFAVSCIDMHKIASNWVHWMLVDIPASAMELPEGASPSKIPAGAKELKNSFGDTGWGGPQPPPGTGVHDYVFTVYALSVDRLKLDGDEISGAEFEKALAGKILGKAKITGKFSR